VSYIYGTPKATTPKNKTPHRNPKEGDNDANICNKERRKQLIITAPKYCMY